MLRARWMVVVALVALGGATQAQKMSRLDGYSTPKVTTLTALRANPGAFKGVWVTFPIQYCGLSRVYNPFFTKFVETDFVSFSAWADGQAIWELQEFRNDFHFLFVDKRSQSALMIYKMKKFQRANITGYVRNTFQGTPWIDVTRIELLPQNLDKTTLFHFVRGRTLMKESKWGLAQAELAKAAGKPGLPPFAQGALWTDVATCLMRQGDFPKAKAALAKARIAQPASEPIKKLAIQLERKPIDTMDHNARVAQLKRWQLPLWQDRQDRRKSRLKVAPIRQGAAKVTAPPGVEAAPQATPPKK